MIQNPNPSSVAKELHVLIPTDLSIRIDRVLNTTEAKSKTQLVLEGLEHILEKYETGNK